jgi:hypothetical protein
MAADVPDRVDVLAFRVRWLDRYRRALSIIGAVALFLVLSFKLRRLLGDTSFTIGNTLLPFAVGGLAWWLFEVAFAWLAAWWETEYDRLTRERGLPRAELVRRRRKWP